MAGNLSFYTSRARGSGRRLGAAGAGFIGFYLNGFAADIGYAVYTAGSVPAVAGRAAAVRPFRGGTDRNVPPGHPDVSGRVTALVIFLKIGHLVDSAARGGR